RQHHRGHHAVIAVDLLDGHALRGAAVDADRGGGGADEVTLLGEHEQLLGAEDLVEADQGPGAVGELVPDDALTTAALQGVLVEWGALAEAALGDREELGGRLLVLGDDGQAHYLVVTAQPDADDALGGAAGVTGALLLEADGLTTAGGEHDVGAAVGDPHRHQLVVVDQVDSYQTGRVDVAVVADGGALDEPVPGREHEVAVHVEALDRQN